MKWVTLRRVWAGISGVQVGAPLTSLPDRIPSFRRGAFRTTRDHAQIGSAGFVEAITYQFK